MAMAVLERVGDRLMAAVPREVEEKFQLAAGDAIAFEDNRDEVTIKKPRRYSLEQLIAEHEQIAEQLEEDRAWLDAPRVGRELI